MSAAPGPRRQIRVLALGDSYTIGEAVHEGSRWPVRLVELLRAAGVPAADPEIVAHTGWTTDELAHAIEAAPPAGPFDLVTLLIGVNNQFRGRPRSEYRSEFADLLDQAVDFAAGVPRRVMVLSIPDWGVTPFAEGRDRAMLAAEIDAFNAVARDEAARRGAHWIDITPGSRRAAREPVLVASDGLHPSGAMYEEWARLAAPIALEIVRD